MDDRVLAFPLGFLEVVMVENEVVKQYYAGGYN